MNQRNEQIVRKERLSNKALREQYPKVMIEKKREERNNQERNGRPLLAARDQALRTNAITARIEKSQTDRKYRLRKDAAETPDCGCQKTDAFSGILFCINILKNNFSQIFSVHAFQLFYCICNAS